MVQKWWKQCSALPSLRKKCIPVYVTFVSMTMEDGGLLFLWPNFTCLWQDWGCITQAYNCYPGLLGRSFTSQVIPVVSVQRKLTNGVAFSCSSGRLLPLHSTISSVKKKKSRCQASSRALPRAEKSSAAAAAKLRQSCPTLCDPIDGSPPGSTVLGFSRQEHWSGLPFPSPMRKIL